MSRALTGIIRPPPDEAKAAPLEDVGRVGGAVRALAESFELRSASASQAEGKRLLTRTPYAETREEAERQKWAFQAWCTKKGLAAVGQALDHDWDRLVTFCDFPRAHWKHLRTSNPIEIALRGSTAAGRGESGRGLSSIAPLDKISRNGPKV